MTNLYFVRHAHSTYTPDELNRPLSEKGYTDAKMITEVLKKEKISRVVSSPYQRAVQTVKGIADYINAEIEMIDSLKERTLSVVPVTDFNVVITKVWEDYDFSWEGGESNLVAQQRGVETIFRLLEKYEGEKIVVGTHGNLMVLILNFFDKQYDFYIFGRILICQIYIN